MSQSKLSSLLQLLLTASLAITLSACQAIPLKQGQSTTFDEYINDGDILPLESITTIDGKKVNLKELGKRKLVVLFASWCSDSNRLLKALNNSTLLDDNTIEIIAIAREEDAETVAQWRDKRGIKVALAVDLDRSIYKRFASGGIPRIITVGENNKVIKMNLAEGEAQLSKIIW